MLQSELPQHGKAHEDIGDTNSRQTLGLKGSDDKQNGTVNSLLRLGVSTLDGLFVDEPRLSAHSHTMTALSLRLGAELGLSVDSLNEDAARCKLVWHPAYMLWCTRILPPCSFHVSSSCGSHNSCRLTVASRAVNHGGSLFTSSVPKLQRTLSGSVVLSKVWNRRQPPPKPTLYSQKSAKTQS